MSVLKYFVPAVALAQSALAQGSCSGPTTIQSGGDATALAPCQTWDGTITMATALAETINLPSSLREITGDLIADGASNMTGLTGSVESIGGTFRLNDVQALTTLQFTELTTVDTIYWNAVTTLYQLMFGTPGVTQVNSLTISDTALTTLDGISPMMAQDILIANNGELQRVTMQLTNVTGNMTFVGNGNNNNLDLRLPNLQGVQSFDIQDCGSIYIPSLASVNGSAAFLSNDALEGLSAPNLTDVGSLRVSGNPVLNNVSFPVLQQCSPGDLNMKNNPKLVGTISFPDLTVVRGAITITGGSWEDFEIPQIQRVAGNTNLSSTQDITSVCRRFKPMVGRNLALKGTYSCRGGADQSGGGGTQGGADNGTNNQSSGASLTPTLAGLFGAFAITLAIFGQL